MSTPKKTQAQAWLPPRPRDDDQGVVAVVGVVLLLAAATMYYAHVVTTDVPRWGRDAEVSWDEDVAHELANVARMTNGAVGTQATIAGSVPPPPEPQRFDGGFIGRATPARPTGTFGFEPYCTNFTASHTLYGGGTIIDMAGVQSGCFRFSAQTAYGDSFHYVIEFGGLVRQQGADAVVLVGPAFGVEVPNVAGDPHRIGLTLVEMDGRSGVLGAGQAGVAFDLIPVGSALEGTQKGNADTITWRFDTHYPRAWHTWFERQFEASNASSSDYTVTCAPVDCSAPGGYGAVLVSYDRPGSTRNDVAVSMSYGAYDVLLG